MWHFLLNIILLRIYFIMVCYRFIVSYVPVDLRLPMFLQVFFVWLSIRYADAPYIDSFKVTYIYMLQS